MLKRLLGWRKEKALLARDLSYEEARDLLERESKSLRLELAKRRDLEPEILYYLAEDSAPEVRREIAQNPATPVHADRMLAHDEVDEIRMDLARKIARIVPELDEAERSRIRTLTLEVLEILANDQLPDVRRIVAEEIKSCDRVPRDLVKRLATDIEATVAVPILEYSPLLSDEDLKEIIATGVVHGGLSAIARRSEVSADVSAAISAASDVEAVAALLGNKNAQIREETLDVIIDQAETFELLHEPLVLREGLSVRAVNRIAGFVAASLVNRLIETHDLDEAMASELRKRVRARIAAPSEPSPDESPRAHAERLRAAGRLDDAMIQRLAGQRELDLLKHGLALLAGTSLEAVESAFVARSAAGLTALAWKAGLSMRTALKIQTDAGQIPARSLIHPRNGVDYPLSEEEIAWQADFFGF